MPLQATSGAASYDAFGGGVAAVPQYIEDVFSTYLYTGNGSTQTITNGIDLAGKGGLVWIKSRTLAAAHYFQDTVRGANNYISSNATNANTNLPALNTVFNSDGFSQNNSYLGFNDSSNTYVSWTFRKQPKFFDVVTYTGNGAYGRAIAHNLKSTPGFFVVKATSTTGTWYAWHRSYGSNYYFRLNETAAADNYGGLWDGTPNDTNFYVSTDANTAGVTYVAYLFAHNAGGFGLTGTDNVISCGSYTGTGAAGNAITLGYEPQWILAKASTSAQYWQMFDVMRGMPVGSSNDAALYPNVSNAEAVNENGFSPTATGFVTDGSNNNLNGVTYIYIAIRRGPMKVPTDGTSVFAPIAATASTGTSRTLGFPADLSISTVRTIADQKLVADRLRGYANSSSATPLMLDTTATAAEAASSATVYNVWNTTALDGPYSNTYSTIWWHFRRAPGFFDEVCYTGDGTISRNQVHNLGVKPELTIVKKRSGTGPWGVVCIIPGSTSQVVLNSTAESPTLISGVCFGISASLFVVGDEGLGVADVNATGQTYVAYFFATCPGVSKVFSFMGNGSTQTINCGFTGGARFVLLKASSATGGWFTYDTARGMTVLTDPYLQLNSTAAETATLGSVTTVTTGFAVNEAITTGVNTNGVTYIGLAIA